MKKSVAYASKQDMLELATLQHDEQIFYDQTSICDRSINNYVYG